MGRHLLLVVLVLLSVSSVSTVALANDSVFRLPVPELVNLAQHGNAAAQYELGQRYRLGRGLPQSAPNALQWYLKSSNQGFPRAESRVAMMYLNGRGGLPKDEALALQLWRKAASQGELGARIGLRVYRSSVVQWMRALPPIVRNTMLMILLMILIIPFLVAVMASFLLCVLGLRGVLNRSKTDHIPSVSGRLPPQGLKDVPQTEVSG